MKPIIKVEKLSKQYRLGTIGAGTIQEDFKRWWYRIQRKDDPFLRIDEINDRTVKGNNKYVWALKDINFDVMPGEILGIIGKNGAGKSTLLKILSKITGPTTGHIKFNGRIGSLLEVGTGFHPDLTGRENIFLNGTILGMTKREVRAKLDEIIDFSGCERYIDTPVKRYSSGMTVRLGFAIAAHLDPEILIVDEVLAVGDIEFQNKAIGKMSEISKGQGRTIIFVSHNTGVISQLCSQTILIKNGYITDIGKTSKVIDTYLQNGSNQSTTGIIRRNSEVSGNHFRSIEMTDITLQNNTVFSVNKPFCISLEIILPEFNSSLELAMRLIDKYKNAVFTIHEKLENLKEDRDFVKIIITIPPNFITPGRYSWIMCINHHSVNLYDLQDDILPFDIIDTGTKFSNHINYGNVFANYKIETLC